MANLDELKAIATALGGNASAATNNVEALTIIAAATATAIAAELPNVTGEDNGMALIVSGGKWAKAAIPSQLPAVTSENNGQVLTVVNGAWAAAALPSG